MSHETERAFLAMPFVPMLAVAAPGRGPLAVPVWHALDAEGRPWFVTAKDSPKARLIAAAGRCTLTAQRDRSPYAYVSVEGPARLETAAYADILEMAIRYEGKADGTAYAESMRAEFEAGSRWRVTLTPERWSSYGLGA
ncbi:MAG: pyridoxamine 5'-phosphate oxidase family protein [Alphaproteobacteria bacterium]|nr:pyridoxamine 5'-phosphate oxidase family protein [Alphaproteobacteria bacterium]MCB9931644.1 pyridoxamine 5'-phosphate oxidase family protein [Alphaproteobacteria bacterium]